MRPLRPWTNADLAVWVLYGLIITGRRTSKLRGDRVSSAYVGLSLYTVLLWTAYPVVWALAEGTNFLSVDQEILAYAVLDVAAKAVFGAGASDDTSLILTFQRSCTRTPPSPRPTSRFRPRGPSPLARATAVRASHHLAQLTSADGAIRIEED